MTALEPRPKITPGQRAQIARAIERARAAQEHRRRDEARAERALQDARRRAECELAERLLEHIADESTIDPGAHALALARTILRAQGR